MDRSHPASQPTDPWWDTSMTWSMSAEFLSNLLNIRGEGGLAARLSGLLKGIGHFD